MDSFHERLAQVGLYALAGYGFAPAGGYAVQAHGPLERPSEDVDLFTTTAAEQAFPDAVRAAIAAYRAADLDVELLVENDSFARLTVHEPSSGRNAKVELGIDWRQYPPTVLDIGPVLSRDDAVANKVCALYSRGQARDYIDVDAALHSQAYTHERLLELAEAHDPGFRRPHFAEALNVGGRLPLAEFTAYGLRPDEARSLVTEWSSGLGPCVEFTSMHRRDLRCGSAGCQAVVNDHAGRGAVRGTNQRPTKGSGDRRDGGSDGGVCSRGPCTPVGPASQRGCYPVDSGSEK